MYVKIELFKTNFDEENVFVGTPSKTVDTVLDGFAASEKLVLPLSPFNLKYPFRLALPYFNVARKYNYARYRFYNTQDETATPADTRYYFVEDFMPIDDQSTEIRAREDILARVFYDLTYQSFLPDRMTYKNSALDRLFDISEFNSTRFENIAKSNFNVEKIVDQDQTPDPEHPEDLPQYKVLGGIIITATHDRFNETIVQDTTYPIMTLFLPFTYREIRPSSSHDTADTFLCIDKSGGSAKSVVSIESLKTLFSYTENGFKIISTNICYNLAGFFKATRNNTEVTVSSVAGPKLDLTVIRLTSISKGVIQINKISDVSTDLITQEFIINGSTWGKTEKRFSTYVYEQLRFPEDRYLFQSPFFKISFFFNGEEKTINLLYVDFEHINVKFILSFLPPYISGITWARGDQEDYFYGTNDTAIFAGLFASGMSFFDFTDNYGEFLRTNYNSLVTGLKVRQTSENEILSTRITSNMFKSGVSMLASTAAGAVKGGAVGAAAGLIGGAAGAINAGIEGASQAKQLAINQEKESKLLDLRLQDMENMPDTVSISSDRAVIEKTRTNCVITFQRNAALNAYKETIKRYGVSSPTRSETMVNHSIFDYVRCTDITFTQKTITLSEVERVAVEKYFRDGVRLWYDYSHYKDFNADNPEV